ncbi:hypothetical protein ABZS81_27640 [Streptomyces sp. NPDC005318]|uniref:hypothetical protein n=1 Tax=Streptomyces sp. NPDC005318 TaxID=3157031 RepID=UPI0033BAA475
MPHHPFTTARTAAYTAWMLTLTVLLSLLLPAGAAYAYAPSGAPAPAAAAPADGDCSVLPLSAFGEAASAAGTVTIPGQESVCFTFTAEAPGLHRLLLVNGNAGNTYASVFDGETPIDCYDPEWGAGWCHLPRDGAYTLRLDNNWPDPSTPTVALIPLGSTEGCAPEIGTAWDSAPVVGSATGPTAVQCQPFAGRPGERITDKIATTVYGESGSWITDETGARICPHFNEDDSEGCVLPGDGPYRVLSQVSYGEEGFPAEYTLKVRRISDPAGCTHVGLNAYNSAPTTVDRATGCKTFTAPAAGPYDVYAVHSGVRSVLAVYDRDGKTVCTTWAGGCRLPAAGDYTVFTDDATLILDRSATAGCEPVELGLHRSTLASGGEVDCLSLPLPEGARLAVLKALNGPAPRPEAIVVDADGVQRCDGGALGSGTCELTGTAPYRALVSTDDEGQPTGPYTLALHRTDTVSSCPAVPAGDFTATGPAARFSTGGGVFSHCLSIPADDHSARENLQLQAAPNTTSTAEFSVLDDHGKQVCSIYPSLSTWTTCDLAPGVAHTVLVTGHDSTAEYTLTRRDVTAGARGCTANPATEVGGPSTGGALGAPGELLCRRVTTGDAKDILHLDVRDALGTANVVVYGADGTALCNQNQACAVTGSTRYQVMVTVRSGLKAAEAYRFDALRIATAGGPSAACEKVPSVAYGYGPVTGTLDEQHTAVCAVLPTAYRDRFDMVISDTTGATETAVPSLYGPKLDNGCLRFVPTGYRCALNAPYSQETTPSILVLSLPEKASTTSYKAEAVCSSTLCGVEQVSIGQISPTTGVTGTKATVRLSGTSLHKGDRVVLSLAGKEIVATTTVVSADRKLLTAEADLTGAAVGTWNLSVLTHNGVQYLRGSFTVTAATLVNSAPPVATGTGRVGDRLTVSTGTWTPAPTSYTYQWNADGQTVPGATAFTYTVPAAMLGKKLSVTVTAHRTGIPDVRATSAAVTATRGAAPRAIITPRITGTAKVGAKLTATNGIWVSAATSYAYQWYANGKAIAGATTSSLTLKSAQSGQKVTVKVTARRTGHASGSATSSATKAVAR